MALWKSIRKVTFDKYTGDDYAKTELSWDYSTSSDILGITTETSEYFDYDRTVPASTKYELMGQDVALAMLELLIDWAETYEREGIVEEMLAKRKVD